MHRVFLLSPAHSGGQRARYLTNESAEFELAVRLRSESGLSLGEAFAFMSGLYFRGKLAYASAFARAPAGVGGVLVIVPGRGLVSAETRVSVADLQAMAGVPVDATD